MTGLYRFLENEVERVYAALRIVAGSMFAFHGVQKLFGVLTDFRAAAGTQVWFGAIIELVGGIAIAVGIFTRCAAFVASGTMAVAYLQFHWRFALGARFFPTINKGELALLYSLLFLYVACRGAGRVSIAAWLARKRASGAPR